MMFFSKCMSICCKKCGSSSVVRNGFVRSQQRYKCKDCLCNFINRDKRTKQSTEIKKALSIILYSLGKSSFGFMGKLFGVNRSTTYRWIRNMSESIAEPAIDSSIKEIEFDKMWHFLNSKKTKNGTLRPWIVAQGVPLLGLQEGVMLEPLEGCMTKLNT